MAGHASPTNSMSDDEMGVKDALLDSIDSLVHSTSIAFSSSLHTDAVVSPGLNIPGHGPVPLPLIPRDAEAIARVCRQAPFGKGDETLVDTSVRKTWELDSAQFETRNPAWAVAVEQYCAQAVQMMGVEGNVRAERYKLLLYEEGAFFKAHRDTEKTPGMFGTLVICLPSRHEGGEVRLSHAGKKTVLDTARNSEFGLSALAWFSDVTHEVKPVTSGYRLFITYNLILNSSITTYSAGRLCGFQSKLQHTLARAREEMGWQKLVYILEHQYTEMSRSLDSLKGSDRKIAEQLQGACAAEGFFLFFAQMNRETELEGEDTYDLENSLSLSCVTTSSGERVCDSMALEMDEILQADPFDRDADSEDEERFTGNASMPARLRYHDSVIVLMPKHKLPPLVPHITHYSPECTANCLNLLCRDIQNQPEDKHQIEQVRTLVRHAIDTTEKPLPGRQWTCHVYTDPFERPNQTDAIGILREAVLEQTWSMSWKDLFQDALRSAMTEKEGKFPNYVTRAFIRSVISETLLPEPHWDERLKPLLPLSLTLKELYDSIEDIKYAIEHEQLRASFEKWAMPTMASRLTHRSIYTPVDVRCLVAISKWMDEEFVISSLLPLICARATTRCLQAILIELYEGRDSHPNQKVVTAMFTKFLEILQTTVLIDHDVFAEAKAISINPSQNESILPIQMTQFIQLITISAELGFVNQVESIINTHLIDWSTEHVNCIAFHRTNAIHFVTNFLFTRMRIPDICEDTAARRFAVVILEGAISTIKRQLPQKPKDWSRPTVKECKSYSHCECSGLNHFLRDPEVQTQGFSMAEKKRKHLERKLNPSHYKMWTERNFSPYTLMIQKTNNLYKEKLQNWHRELAEFKNEFRGLQQPLIEKLLGERYDDLVRLKELNDWEMQLQPQPTSRTKRQALAPLAEPKLILNHLPPVEPRPAPKSPPPTQNPTGFPLPTMKAASAVFGTGMNHPPMPPQHWFQGFPPPVYGQPMGPPSTYNPYAIPGPVMSQNLHPTHGMMYQPGGYHAAPLPMHHLQLQPQYMTGQVSPNRGPTPGPHLAHPLGTSATLHGVKRKAEEEFDVVDLTGI